MTNDLTPDLAALTPEQRELLALRLDRARRRGDAPLSSTQEQLWFLDRVDPGTPVYDVPFALRLRGPLDVLTVRGALDAVVRRQEALRTVFTEHKDGPRQRVLSTVDIPMPVTDLRAVPEQERERAVERESIAHGRHSFDLLVGPLLAVRLLVLADDDHVLLVNVHHIVFDAWSADVFVTELAAYYGHLAAGEPVDLPPLREQFADYARRQRDPAAQASVAAQLGYWRDRLTGAPPTSTVPPDRPRPAVQSHRGARHAFMLDAALTRRMAELARELAVTPNAVVLAAFTALLRQATGQDDLLFGMPTASRPRVDLEPLIGSFANMMVLRLDASGDPTVGDLVVRAHRAIGEAYRHQDAPYARVVEEAAPLRDPRINPLFQVMLTLARGGDGERSAAGVTFAQMPVATELTDFDLFVGMTVQDGRYEVVLDYNTDLYLAETVEHLEDRLTAVLGELAGDPGRPLGSVPSLRRETVAVAATFTVDPVRAPLQFWLDVLRAPAGVHGVPYGQMIPHLLAGEGGAATVCLVRWDDFLRHVDVSGGPAAAAGVLDAAVRDLHTAVEAYRRRSSSPLVVVVCPSSPRFRDRPWTALFARLDDRLAQLQARVDGVHVRWAEEDANRHGASPHDPVADELGHVPYTPEYSAVLGTLAARLLWQASGRTARLLVADPERAPDLARRFPHLDVVSCPAGETADRLGELLTARGVAPDACVVLDPDPVVVAAVRSRHPGVVALVPAVDDRELDRLWVLDPPLGAVDGPFPAMGPERAAYLAERLADPAAVADRVAVRAVLGTTAERAPAAPRTETEQRLAALWCEVLRLDEVGTDDDFFALGGHSLLATQLLSWMHRDLHRTVSLYTFFTHPTVGRLAAVLDAEEPDGERLLPAPRTAEAVASPIQQRLWALAQLDGAVRHNTTFAAALHGDLDESALRRAVEEIVRRHEVLRTVFADHRGRPVPVLRDDMATWEVVDLSPLAADDRDAAVADHVARHVTHRHDLAQGPLLRVRLLRGARDEHHLLVGMHHIVCDNVSWRVFLEELATLYGAFTAGLPSPLPPLPLQFTDVTYRRREWLDSAAVEPHLAYWQEALHDAPPPLELPGDLTGSPAGTDLAGRHVHLLPAELGAAMRHLAREEGVTPFSVALAAFGVLLHRETGQTDLVVGTPSDGREGPELDGMIGCFADLLALRLDLAGRPTFRRLVRRLHTTVNEAHAHQRIPSPKIMEALALPRDASRHPLKCVLNYSDLADETPTLPGVDVMPLPVEAPGADFDLLLTVDWQDDHLRMELTYSAGLYSAEWADRLAAGFGTVLAEALAAADEPLGARAASRTEPEAQPVRSDAVALACTFPADRFLATMRFWSDLLPEPALSVTAAPEGQVLRPLLDPRGPFDTDADGLKVVLLRWEDLPPSLPGSVHAAVEVLQRALSDLGEAVQAFRARSASPLLLGVCPPSPRLSGGQWTGVLDDLTEGLRRSCARWPDVDVVAMDHWARRYVVEEPDGAEFDAAVATAIVRETRRRWHAPVSTVVLDPDRAAAPRELTRFVRDQVRYGRDVVLTSAPASPELAALVRRGTIRVASADAIGSGDGCYRVSDPGAARHLWVLDPPAPRPGDVAALPDELLLAIATDLDTAHRIWATVESGYRRPAQRESGEPRTDRERALAAIWADALQLDEVGIHDDFYELGGDSLLTITVAFHAGEAGLDVTARQIMQHRTIAALCAASGELRETGAEQGVVTGEMPLTPAQLWWCETVAPTMARPAHFNHPYYVELRRRVPVAHLAEAVRGVAEHHDALRLRVRRDDDGTWRQWYAPEADAVPFTSHDLSALPAAEQDRAMESLAADAQRGLDLTDGPLCRVVHFGIGPDRPDRLLIVAHHLVTDAVSRGLLLEDLQTVCGQLGRGETPRLRAKTTSYRTWAMRLTDEAATARDEPPFWLDQTVPRAGTVPPDHPGGVTAMGTPSSVDATLSAADTAALHDVARRLRVNLRDLLVWGVAEVVAARSGGTECLFATTGHGRGDLDGDVDVSRTVGWFQVLYPVRVHLSPGTDDTDSVSDVAAQLARVPRNGLGYGLLRFASPDPEVRQRLAALPAPRIAVNYMGTFGFDAVSQVEELLDVCDAPYGPTEDESGTWPFDLDVVGTLTGGRLRLEIGYGPEVYRRETAEGLLGDLRARLRGLVVSGPPGPAGP